MAAPPPLYTAVLTTVPVFAMYKLQAFPLIRNARLWLWLLWLDAVEHQVQQVRTHLFRYYNRTTQPCRIGSRLSVCTGLPPLPAGEPLTVRGGGGRGYSARTSNSWSYFRPGAVPFTKEAPASKPTKIPRILAVSANYPVQVVKFCWWGCLKCPNFEVTRITLSKCNHLVKPVKRQGTLLLISRFIYSQAT